MNDLEKKTYVTEVIGDSYKNCFGGYHYNFISAPTGSGKTYFYMNQLREDVILQEKHMLILTPRVILEEQLKEDFRMRISQDPLTADENIERISFMSYQRCAYLARYGAMKEYDIIVCDEAHYFLTDSLFGTAETQDSFDWVMAQKRSCLVFVSATIEELKNYIIGKFNLRPAKIKMGKTTICTGSEGYQEFSMENDYSTLSVRYINKDEETIEVCKKKGVKTIVFVSSIQSGERLKSDLEKSSIKVEFINAQNKDKEGADVIKQLTRKSMFDAQVLITTSVLDVGVNIKDPDLTQIIICTYEKESLIQMLGRVRVPRDKGYVGITLYLYNIQSNYINKRLSIMKSVVRAMDEYYHRKTKDNALFLLSKKGEEEDYKFIYSTEQACKHSELCMYRSMKQVVELQEILDELKVDEYSFIKRQLSRLGLDDEFSLDNFVSQELRIEAKKKLEEQLEKNFDELHDIQLEKKQREDFLLNLKEQFRNLNAQYIRSNETFSYNRFNELCQIEHLPYKILVVKGKPTKYQIVKEDNKNLN